MRTTVSRKLLLFLGGILLLARLGGCAAKSPPVAIEGAERDQVLAKVEPIADRVFQGMVKHDYAMFTTDFDVAMRKAMPESGFTQMMQVVDSKVGAYQSRQVAKVERVGKYVAVTYTVRFEQEEGVACRLVLTPGDPMLVSGFWYDSPKLRSK